MRQTLQMNEFDAFNVCLAFKLHFTTDRYDITKTRGAVKTKDETFYKGLAGLTSRDLQKSLVKMSYQDF